MLRNDRFELQEELGRGVSSIVYKARDLKTNTIVALKALNPHLQSDQTSIERFRRELRITRALVHPGVIKIFDFIEEGSAKYLIMELLSGTDLKAFGHENGPVTFEYALSFLSFILGVLDACHQKNVIHRDIKPQNIFATGPQSWKLLDFGISRMISMSEITMTGTSLGSPEYMAPELFSFSCFNPRTDIYALGVVVYELLAGELPFQSETIAMLFKQHATESFPSIRKKRPDVPEWFEEILLKMTHKDEIQRYQIVDEIQFDIAQQRVQKFVIDSKKIACIACEVETLYELDFCLNCGYTVSLESSSKSGVDIYYGQTESREKLKSFLETSFGYVHSKIPKFKNILIARNIDSKLAGTIQKRAAQKGLQIDIESRSLFQILLRFKSLATCFILFLCFIGGSLFSAYELKKANIESEKKMHFVEWAGTKTFKSEISESGSDGTISLFNFVLNSPRLLFGNWIIASDGHHQVESFVWSLSSFFAMVFAIALHLVIFASQRTPLLTTVNLKRDQNDQTFLNAFRKFYLKQIGSKYSRHLQQMIEIQLARKNSALEPIILLSAELAVTIFEIEKSLQPESYKSKNNILNLNDSSEDLKLDRSVLEDLLLRAQNQWLYLNSHFVSRLNRAHLIYDSSYEDETAKVFTLAANLKQELRTRQLVTQELQRVG